MAPNRLNGKSSIELSFGPLHLFVVRLMYWTFHYARSTDSIRLTHSLAGCTLDFDSTQVYQHTLDSTWAIPFLQTICSPLSKAGGFLATTQYNLLACYNYLPYLSNAVLISLIFRILLSAAVCDRALMNNKVLRRLTLGWNIRMNLICVG